MATYTTTPQDDSNLDVTVTEGEVTEINIQPAAVTIQGTGEVTSVNGLTGAVVLDTDDITEGSTNLYYSDTLARSALSSGTGVTYVDSTGVINIGQPVETDSDVTFNSMTGDLYGAIHLNVKNDEGAAISQGDPVYFKGVSGNNITVGIADANDPAKMPAFGIAATDANNNATLDIITSGKLSGIDTSAYSVNDELYVSTAGDLTTQRPTGADDLIQKMARVERVHANNGSIYVMGAGRSNDIPNLATSHVFVGNGGGYEKRQLSYTELTNTPTIPTVPTNVSAFTNDAGYLTSETDSQTLSFANPNLTISNGNTVDLSALTPDTSASDIDVTTTNFTGHLSAADTTVQLALETLDGLTIPTTSSSDIIAAIENNPAELQLSAGIQLGDNLDLNNNNILNGTTEIIRPNGNGVEVLAEAFGDWLNFYSDNGGYAGTVKYGVAQSSAAGFAAYVSQQTNNGHRILDIKAVQDTGDTFDSGVHNTEYWFYGDSENRLISADQTVSGRIPLNVDASQINLNANVRIDDLYTLPTSDGTNGQVIVTDGAGNLSFADASGGGASALGDLTDVTLTSVVDGDLLRYNGTANEWQNTNLGLSVTPTFTVSDTYVGTENIVTITNWNSYDDPAIFVEVYDSGSTRVIENSAVTDLGGGDFKFTTPAVGTNYEVQVRVQDFGDLASEIGTDTFDSLDVPAHRYYRLTFNNATSYNMIDRWNFYTGVGQTGTRYPTSGMTSNTTPTPFVASADREQSGYSAYEAFDLSKNGLGGSWWNLGSTSYADSWLQLDLGSAVQISSWLLNPVANATYVNCDGWYIHSSATGAFAGEEVLRATVSNDGSYEYPIG